MSVIEVLENEVLDAVASESEEISVESQGRIGVGSEGQPSSIILKVHVPLNAQITRIIGYLRNAAWPDGCDLGSSHWHVADLFNYHEPIGWSYAGHVRRGTTPSSQWVSAIFVNWVDCNARFGRLRVFYKFPKSLVEDIQLTEIESELQGLILPK